jgi:regulatory protein
LQKNYFTKEQAIQKLHHYCNYQERSHYEVQQKLWELGISKSDHDEIISKLIEEDYLNEERFAIEFAGGKFRMKDWGKKKISYALKEKRVSDYNIKKALAQIDDEDYQKIVESLAAKKWEELKSEQYLVRKKKTIDYLVQKGFEYNVINEVLANFQKS